MSSTKIARYTTQNGLPSPLFDWSPFFTALPDEVIELILSNFAFHALSKHQLARTPEILELAKVKIEDAGPHPFNVIAATSPRLRHIVEQYSKHLIKTHSVPPTCPKCNCVPRATRATKEPAKTQRSLWLRHISHSCAFCGHVDDYGTSKDTLILPMFNPSILSCSACDEKTWPRRIKFTEAVSRYHMPECLFFYPPRPLRWGRKLPKAPEDFPAAAAARAQVMIDRHFEDYLLEDEVHEAYEMILADPRRYVPVWMLQLPRCFEMGRVVMRHEEEAESRRGDFV